MKLTVTGSIAFDYLMHFPGKFADALKAEKLDAISVSFLVQDMTKHRGGTGGNIAYTIGLLGGAPLLMATAGKDFKDYKLGLDEAGVDTSAILVIEDEYTSSFFANTDLDENQIASFYAGAMAHAGKLSFESNAPYTDLAIVSPNDPEAMRAYVAECQESGIDYIFDPSQQTLWLSGHDLREGIDGCFLLAVNDYELHLIEEKTRLSEDDIVGLCGGLIVTLGKRGSRIRVGDLEYHIPIVPPTEVLDPTGAGDAFRAGIMRALQLGLDWKMAGRFAALSATYAIENMGPQGHEFTRDGFVKRFREHFDDNGALDDFS